ncbi:MAG: cytochrome b/b6 domain-containing protein [Alphaproteobacteria bacterium]
MKNTQGAYGLVARSFHWITALIILGLLSVGFYMADMDVSPDKFKLYWLHKSFGILVLILVAGRILWRISNPKVEHLATHKTWERHLADAAHVFLYLLIIAMPLSGWLMSSAGDFPAEFFGFFSLPVIVPKNESLFHIFRDTHEIFALLIIAVIDLHVAGALKHHFIDRDGTLQRMTFARLGLTGGLFLACIAGILLASPVVIYTYNELKPEAALENAATSLPTTPTPGEMTSSAPAWGIDLQKSAIHFDATQYGKTFSGFFKIAGGRIFFDSEKMAGNRVAIDIDIASLETGNGDRDTQAQSSDWFNQKEFPHAHFAADRFEKLSPGKYRAHGAITLRDKTLSLSFPFALEITGDTAHVIATLHLNRLDFGVGQGEWGETDIIGNPVSLRLDVTSVRE